MLTRYANAYIVAARRTVNGRVGGLHRNRRLEDLVGPVVAAVLTDARLAPADVEELILGNSTAGGNPARLAALAAGLPDHVQALTLDRRCGSGLEAVLAAIRKVAHDEAEVVLAGGAESVSTAPWRVARPRSPHQLPHFIEPGFGASGELGLSQLVEATEDLAARAQITRRAQDAYAAETHRHAAEALDAGRFQGETVPLKVAASEIRDEPLGEPLDAEELAGLPAFREPGGTVTGGNCSAHGDAAAIVAVVSEAVWERLGRPPGLQLLASAGLGVAPSHEAKAPIAAMQKLHGRINGFKRSDIGCYELNESSAAQAIAFRDELGIERERLNPDGGALARGYPLAASSAVTVVRLFSRLVLQRGGRSATSGVVATGAIGGLGLAALFSAC